MEDIKIQHLDPNNQPHQTWIAMCDGNIVGHIYMTFESDNRIKFMDAFVHSDYRRRGIFRLLWDTRWEYVLENYSGWTVYAWCKESSLPLLKEKGFTTGEISTYVEKVIK